MMLVYRTKRFRLKITDFNPFGGVRPGYDEPPKENQGSAHFETKVASETSHNLRVVDQKILSD